MRTHEHRPATLWIPLADVHLAARRRRTVDPSTVERYREWLEQGCEAPPVRVARHGDGFLLRDGRHRVAAALAAGYVVIEAEVARIGAAVITRLERWRRAAARAARIVAAVV
jgi:hypothetical protein